jgi:hypothetical protein
MIGWLLCLRERNGAAVEMTEGGRRTRGYKQSTTELESLLWMLSALL